MTHTFETTADEIRVATTPGVVQRSLVLSYGITAYGIGVFSLAWLLLGMGGLAPVGFSPLQTQGVWSAMLVNTLLIVLFGIQHSVMARKNFKQWLKKFMPEATERATYLLMSAVVTMLALYLWQPIDGVVWSVQDTVVRVVLWSIYALGAGYLLVSTLATNHFELMGLRQVYLYFRNRSYTSLPFTRKYMYSYSRHPMMLGMLLAMWALPEMSISHFILSGLFTLYMAIGVMLEERDLARQFGEAYQQYKKQIATFIPKVF